MSIESVRISKEIVFDAVRPFLGLMMDYHKTDKELLLIDLFATSEYGECGPVAKIEDERVGNLLKHALDLAMFYLGEKGMTYKEMYSEDSDAITGPGVD